MEWNQIIEELNNLLQQSVQKDIWDYIGIVAPIILSVVAILISMWNSFWSQNIKKLEANMIWEDIRCSYFIIIRNTGKKTLVINSASLSAYDKKSKKNYELGVRNNAWSIKQEKGYIETNEMVVIAPIYGSIYDVFAYKGHCFDVTDEIKELKVCLTVTDIDGKAWRFDTPFTLGEIDEKLSYASTVDVI